MIISFLRRGSKKKPVLSRCPVCGETFQLRPGREFRHHLNNVHHEFWGWYKRWVRILFLESFLVIVALIGISSVFPTLGKSNTLAGILYRTAAITVLELSVIGLSFWYRARALGKFRGEWREQHPQMERAYGNLHGIVARLSPKGRVLRRLLFLPPLLSPTVLIVDLAWRFRHGGSRPNVVLDRFEDGKLSFYDSSGFFTTLELKTPLSVAAKGPRRVRIALPEGALDIKAKSSSDGELLLTVLS